MNGPTIAPTGTYRGTPQRVAFGPGSVAGLGQALQALDVQRAMVVTGPTVASLPILDTVLESAGSCELHVFAGSRPHGPRGAAREGLAAARDCGAEALVSLGGSSPVEVARAIALLAGTGADFEELAGQSRFLPGTDQRTDTWPVISITTTLSQAEFSNVVGVTDERTGEKQLFFDDGLMPRHVFLDGELALHTPQRLWLSTGIKALDTAIDLFLQHGAEQPFWDPLLLRAIRALVDLLPASADRPDDVGVRQELQVSAWMALFPRFHLPLDHAVPDGVPWFGAAARHQLGGLLGLPHGELGGIILREALRFHLDETRGRQLQLAAALSLDSVEELHDRLHHLVADLGLPTDLGAVDLTDAQLEAVVAACVSEQPAFAGQEDQVRQSLENLR